MHYAARMPRALPRACVIGAGSSGIAACKALQDRGIEFDCFEKSDRVGGNWVFANSNGMSAAYRSLHINTSRERMEYADHPMPSSYPDFAHHTQIAAYFEDYVDHFGLRELITFETGVAHAQRDADGGWTITLEDGEQRRYDALLIANGHHWDPRWPEPPYPGTFDGRQLHSHQFLDAGGWRDQNVLVVGIGNSAMDIAVECSYVARRTFLSSRRGAYVLPKYVFGRPLDQIGTGAAGVVPWPVRRTVLAIIYRIAVGRVERYGLPTPDHRIGEAHPTVSGGFLQRLADGEIAWKPNVDALDGDHVGFTDGSREPIDVIVWCTGYKVSFPFFDPAFISAPDNDLPLYRHVFRPGIDNLFFVALLQPLGATMPIAEAQGQWIADYLCGDYRLPPEAVMAADIGREREQMAKRYVASKRHTMQVDFDAYMHALANERRAGAARARAAAYALPVAPRVQGAALHSA